MTRTITLDDKKEHEPLTENSYVAHQQIEDESSYAVKKFMSPRGPLYLVSKAAKNQDSAMGGYNVYAEGWVEDEDKTPLTEPWVIQGLEVHLTVNGNKIKSNVQGHRVFVGPIQISNKNLDVEHYTNVGVFMQTDPVIF